MNSRSFLFALCLIWPMAFLSQGINISSSGGQPDPSAGLDVNFNDKGFLPPRMTSTQRDQISNPALGLTIFNTTSSCLEFFVGGIWQKIGCGCPGAPASPTAGSHVVTDGSVLWVWSAVDEANGYKWNTVNDYGSAQDIGNLTSYTQFDPACESPLSLFVWSYNACGNSSPVELTATGPLCQFVCGDAIAVNHIAGSVSPESKAVNYGTLTYNGKCWADRNLGAENQASSATDATNAAAGWYWQFNRIQGYAPGPAPAWNTNPIVDTEPWQSENDPCLYFLGTGWHIPTESQWLGAISYGSWTNYTTSFASDLKIHGAGYLETSSGGLQDRGSYGLYWANSAYYGTSGRTMRVNGGSAAMDNGYVACGFSIRCVKD